jgi:hypothetical protein
MANNLLEMATLFWEIRVYYSCRTANETHAQSPVSPWAKEKHYKEVGTWGQVAILEGVEAYSLFLFLQILKWDMPRLQILMARVRAALKDKKSRLVSSV